MVLSYDLFVCILSPTRSSQWLTRSVNRPTTSTCTYFHDVNRQNTSTYIIWRIVFVVRRPEHLRHSCKWIPVAFERTVSTRNKTCASGLNRRHWNFLCNDWAKALYDSDIFWPQKRSRMTAVLVKLISPKAVRRLIDGNSIRHIVTHTAVLIVIFV
jgi:hypothetical protein